MKRSPGTLVDYMHGDTLAYRATFRRLAERVPFDEISLATTLPRGGLQIIQPRQIDTARMRRYVREHHLLDVPAWFAIGSGRIVQWDDLVRGAVPAQGAGASGEQLPVTEPLRRTAGRFRADYLEPNGWSHYAAVPLQAPVLEGYPGVLQVFRKSSTGPFSAEELALLEAVARELDDAARHDRRKRSSRESADVLRKVPTRRQVAFAPGEGIIFPPDKPFELDEVVQERLHEAVHERLAALRGDGSEEVEASEDADDIEGGRVATGGNVYRLLVPDRHGDAWPFRLSLFPKYPAINQGRDEPVAVVSLQPDCEAWSDLRPSDFEADEEIARLIPALQFMQENYTSGLTLTRIARTVHLSPFHFHRRFTELLGITPKHFIFDCQVAEAKRELRENEASLAEVARKCGFAHQSHFTSRFKQATGLTPTKWRRLVLEREKSGRALSDERPAAAGR